MKNSSRIGMMRKIKPKALQVPKTLQDVCGELFYNVLEAYMLHFKII